MTKKIKAFKIELPTVVTPSASTHKKWDRDREFYRFKEEKRIYTGLLLIALGCRIDEFTVEPKAKRSVEFHSYRPRLLDDDNLAQGFKYLRDTLTRLKLIHNDSPKFLEASYFQHLEREEPMTILIIRDM